MQINTAILGGAGFLGKYITTTLLETGRKINIFDINPIELNHINLKFTDVSDFKDNDYYEKLKECDEIIDLVYASNPKTSFDNPIKDIIENLPTTTKLFTIASKLKKLKKFIYFSSGGTVYGNNGYDIQIETNSTDPISPYGITKLALEKYGLMHYNYYKLPIVIVRPANACGQGQKINTGQGFITHAIHSILQNKTIKIFGEKGTIRDYIHAEDISSAILHLLDLRKNGEIYNIGTGVGTSNIEILKLLKPMASRYNLNVDIEFLDERKFDVEKNILNNKKLKNDTGWSPKIELTKGLENTFLEFFKRYQDQLVH